MGFYGAVTGDNLLAALCATRDEIARDLEGCDSMRDKAALYLRLTDVLARIDVLTKPTTKGDAVDEISQRRTARRSGRAKGAARAKRSG